MCQNIMTNTKDLTNKEFILITADNCLIVKSIICS